MHQLTSCSHCRAGEPAWLQCGSGTMVGSGCTTVPDPGHLQIRWCIRQVVGQCSAVCSEHIAMREHQQRPFQGAGSKVRHQAAHRLWVMQRERQDIPRVW